MLPKLTWILLLQSSCCFVHTSSMLPPYHIWTCSPLWVKCANLQRHFAYFLIHFWINSNITFSIRTYLLIMFQITTLHFLCIFSVSIEHHISMFLLWKTTFILVVHHNSLFDFLISDWQFGLGLYGQFF